MSKRRKISTTHTSLRLPPDLLIEVNKLAMSTGWSNAKCIGFLADLGNLAIRGGSAAIAAARDHLAGQVKIHQVEKENAGRLAAARKEARPAGWKSQVKALLGGRLRRPARPAGRKPAATAVVKPASKPESA